MDIILYNILVSIIVLIFSYLMGSIPFGLIFCKAFLNKDPRLEGSGNPGSTNIARLYGKKMGYTVMVFDVLKSILPLWIAWAILTFVPFDDKPLLPKVFEIANGSATYDDYILKFPVYWLCAIGVIFGHCFPIFSRFKGGKGSANVIGTFISTNWTIWPTLTTIFLILVRKTRVMSISVIIANGVSLLQVWILWILTFTKVLPSIFLWLPGFGPSLEFSLIAPLTYTFIYCFLLIRHSANIKRLKNHEENKTNLF